MATNSWNTVHNTEKRQMIHTFDHRNMMVVTDLINGSSIIINLTENLSSLKVDISHYSLEQYFSLLNETAKKDQEYASK